MVNSSLIVERAILLPVLLQLVTVLRGLSASKVSEVCCNLLGNEQAAGITAFGRSGRLEL